MDKLFIFPKQELFGIFLLCLITQYLKNHYNGSLDHYIYKYIYIYIYICTCIYIRLCKIGEILVQREWIDCYFCLPIMLLLQKILQTDHEIYGCIILGQFVSNRKIFREISFRYLFVKLEPLIMTQNLKKIFRVDSEILVLLACLNLYTPTYI